MVLKEISNKGVLEMLEELRYGFSYEFGNPYHPYSGCTSGLRSAMNAIQRSEFSIYELYKRDGLEGLIRIRGVGKFSGPVIEKILLGESLGSIRRSIRDR